MEKQIFALKLSKPEKKAMDFTSKEFKNTLSKIYYPFIIDGLYYRLGILLLYKIDIQNKLPIDRYADYFSPVLSPAKSSSEVYSNILKDLDPMDILVRHRPPVLDTFLELLERKDIKGRLEKVFTNVDFKSSQAFFETINLDQLAYNLGRQYFKNNKDFSKTDFTLMRDIYFSTMLREYFQATAVGSLKTLQFEWYNKRSSVTAFKEILIKEYSRLLKNKPVEAPMIVEPLG